MSDWPDTERRKFRRDTKAIQIELRSEESGVPVRTETADLSESGCYVHMSITMELGAKVSVALWLGDEKVCGTGRVVTRHPQFGNGIELELAQEGRERLRRFLQEPS